ncbi:MAG TPA: hypothetical protein VKT82_26380 [Ktedonobacterales bacterium]|nr:hypothetical protein [Ktedonobacterales bacterium]
MPNHMSTIGFPFQGREGFDRLARQAAEFGETIASPGGSYRVWAPGAGAELWAQRNEQGTLIGLNPHFSGKARMRVGLTRRIHYPQSSALDGAFYGWAGAPDEDAESGEFPFVFDTPDYRSYDALSLPRVVTVQLVAFMHSLTAFEHEEAMGASDGWMNWMAPESCIPNGIFTPDGTIIEPPKAEIIFCGRVLETARLVNPFTQQAFYWALVRTLGGEMDVVADPEVVQGTIIKDGIVGGTCWVSGRVKE